MTDTDLLEEPGLLEAARTALACSRFVARSLTAELGGQADDPSIVAWLVANAAEPWDRARIEAFLETDRRARHDLQALAWLPAALRRLRRRVLLGVIVRDVAGRADLQEVTATMTALAECSVQHAVQLVASDLAAVHGVAADERGLPQDLLVVAMGKGGGGELNVSSDLDLVFVYDGEGTTQPPSNPAGGLRSIGNQEFFERLGRRLIALLSESTADGFVFRIDMRLRPNGDAGPLVVSCAMLEEYLTRQGREWERFAWIKARVISAPVLGDAASFAAQVASLEACVRPFVYRRYLDFNAIGALRELHAKIRRQTRRRARDGSEGFHHVKLGGGGIREIEFVAQTFQVIRGGRDASLRSRSTLPTLDAIGALGLLPPDDSRALASAYRFLRRLEHALQYVEDAQTHLIPPDTAAREQVARLLGMAGADQMMMLYEQHSARVAGIFDRIFAARERLAGAADPGAADLVPRLAALGFDDPASMAERVAALLASPRVAASSEANRARIVHLTLGALPVVVEVALQLQGRAGIQEIFPRWLQLLEVIAGRSTYIALLDEYPQALARVVRLLAAGRWASEYLTRHPILLDELLDERIASQVPGQDFVSDWVAELESDLLHADGDGERLMNLMRDAHHAQVFRLLLADVNGLLQVEALADQLSALADATLDLSLSTLWRRQRGPGAPAPRMAIVAYGKLGGKELGYASDLDLIFVYDDPDPEAPTVYAQLVRRLVSWLSAPTSSGMLFEIDLRLRPNGNAGLMVTSMEAFERYQFNADGRGAWAWEHQALTRARACAGDRELGRRIEQVRRDVLAQPRDLATLATEVLSMRGRMLQGHPNRSELFDLKHDRGGMVDIEFTVQYLVLAHAHRCPQLLDNLGNIALLRIAAELALIEPELASAAADAYRDYRRLQHGLRLDAEPFARVAHAQVAGHIEVVHRLWRDVFGSDEPAGPAR